MPASLVSPNVRLPVSGIRGIRLRHWVSRALERLTGPSKRVSVLRYRPGQGCISGPGRHTGHSGHGRIVVLWHGMDTLPRYRGSLNYKVSVCLGPRASGTATSSLRCGRRERTATSSLSVRQEGTYGYLVAFGGNVRLPRRFGAAGGNVRLTPADDWPMSPMSGSGALPHLG
jgi:hypothetical protein